MCTADVTLCFSHGGSSGVGLETWETESQSSAHTLNCPSAFSGEDFTPVFSYFLIYHLFSVSGMDRTDQSLRAVLALPKHKHKMLH